MVFKTLGYPYTISKTSLSAVGSPHAWPQLLGAIEWLVELLCYDKEAVACGGHAAAGFAAGEDLTREGDIRFIEYLGLAYGAFLAGEDDDYKALENEFSDSFIAQTTEVKTLVATAADNQSRLMREIDAEKHTGALLPVKREKLAVLESDHEKLCEFVEKLKEHIANLDTKVSTKQNDLAAERSQCDAAKETVKALKARIAAQELSADEAQRMVSEKERIERTLSEAVAYHQAMRQKAWEADMDLGRRTEELERGIHSYTAQATALQLLPRGSKNAQGADFRIVVNKERLTQATGLTDVLTTDVAGTILPALHKFKDLVGKKAGELRSSAAVLADQEEHSQEALEEAADNLVELQVAPPPPPYPPPPTHPRHTTHETTSSVLR
jgi:kinetochore protein NDC80